MAFAGTTLALSLAIGPFIGPATAATVAVSFSGTIQTVSQEATAATGVVVGDPITGSFAYDSTQSGSVTTGLFTFTGSSKIHSMSFKIFDQTTGVQVFSDLYSGDNTAYYAAQLTYISAQSGTTLDLKGDTTYKQGLGVTGPGPPPAFDLTMFNPTNGGGYTATNLPLPTTTTIVNFSKTTGQLNWDPSGQSFTADIPNFTVQGVPEPSGLLLGIISILTCAAGSAVIRRGRVAAPVPPRPGSPV
jgi:hypothetical protein